MFTFGPEWCSASLRNAVQIRRNPQVIEEVLGLGINEDYFQYLRHKLDRLAPKR